MILLVFLETKIYIFYYYNLHLHKLFLVHKNPFLEKMLLICLNCTLEKKYINSQYFRDCAIQIMRQSPNFAKKFTKASLASIGSQIGKRDHATVLHACKTVDNLSSTDKQFRKYVEDLTKKLSV